MPRRLRTHSAVSALFFGALAALAPAQCPPNWSSPGFMPLAASHPVFALEAFDDGGGVDLYVGGNFTTIGGTAASRIAKWDGLSWSALGAGVNNAVWDMAIWDDDGSGPHAPALFVAGTFTTAGRTGDTPQPASRIAKWDGAAWIPLGAGTNNFVYALEVFDDGLGGGPALYAAGFFTQAGGANANRIAKWNGVAWSPLGGGLSGTVFDLEVLDPDASGPEPAALYAGGIFQTAGGTTANNIASWNGSAWIALGTGTDERVWTLCAHDDGAGGGTAMYVGGEFQTAGGIVSPHLSKYTPGLAGAPGTWSSLGGSPNFLVRSLAIAQLNPGASPALCIGGAFTAIGEVTASRLATWSVAPGGTQPAFQSVGAAPFDGANNLVYDVAVFDDGSLGSDAGPSLYIGGQFTTAGGHAAANVGRFGPLPPRVMTGPSPFVTTAGRAATFSVVAESLSGQSLAHQWFHNGVMLSDGPGVSGATTSSLTLANVQTTDPVADTFGYHATVSDGCGQASSAPAPLTVLCAADFNRSGATSSADLTAFLAAWFLDLGGQTLLSDIDSSGSVGSADMSVFLQFWFASLASGC
ncbi:MAG: hypothetical protein H7Y88_04560 [Phycisphaerales bacterium]|nr:hypothetical protein [Phycisphaerales bacterium]